MSQVRQSIRRPTTSTNDLIIHRNAIKAKLETASEADKPALKSDEQAIKILANATSYGIFVELNVEDYVTAKPMVGYGGRSRSLRFKSKDVREAGRILSSAARHADHRCGAIDAGLAEHQVIEHGLDWVFCDTDSIAIANTRNLPREEFVATALKVREWFKDLNPYGEDRSILQLEKVNFPPGRDGDLQALDPPVCLAVSAKRYVLFNRQNGSVVVRKASGHGLGHLMAPYDEPPAERRERIERIGVPLWQEDLWKEIIRAADSDKPDETRFMEMPGFRCARREPICGDDAGATQMVRRIQRTTAERASGSSPSVFSCRCRPSRGSKWPRMSPTHFLMNFGGGESRGPLRPISSSRMRPRIMHSIESEVETSNGGESFAERFLSFLSRQTRGQRRQRFPTPIFVANRLGGGEGFPEQLCREIWG